MLITGFISGSCPSRAVATIETLIFPFNLSSSIEPKIKSASGSTSARILFTASATSNKVVKKNIEQEEIKKSIMLRW